MLLSSPARPTASPWRHAAPARRRGLSAAAGNRPSDSVLRATITTTAFAASDSGAAPSNVDGGQAQPAQSEGPGAARTDTSAQPQLRAHAPAAAGARREQQLLARAQKKALWLALAFRLVKACLGLVPLLLMLRRGLRLLSGSGPGSAALQPRSLFKGAAWVGLALAPLVVISLLTRPRRAA